MSLTFTHIVDKKLAAAYCSGNVQTIHYGNLHFSKVTLLSTFWHRLNKGECRKAFGRPSALSTDFEGKPDLHVFETTYKRIKYTLLFFADSANSGRGSGAEIVSNKAAGHYFKVTGEFLKFLLKSARTIKPAEYAKYRRAMQSSNATL